MGCVRFPCYSDRKLTNGTVIWQENRLIDPVILFEGFSFPLESFTLKVAESPNGRFGLIFVNDISESSQLPQANFMFKSRVASG